MHTLSTRTLYNISQLYKHLPAEFGRQYAITDVAKHLWLRPRTVDKYLAILCDDYHKMERLGNGDYRKV
jgi:hypothetical protein